MNKKLKLNVFLLLYTFNLLIIPWFPYLKTQDNSDDLIFDDPILWISYLSFVVLTSLIFIIRRERWNYVLVCIWLILSIIASLGAYMDYDVNSIDCNVQWIGSAAFQILFFGPLALVHWLIRRFGEITNANN